MRRTLAIVALLYAPFAVLSPTPLPGPGLARAAPKDPIEALASAVTANDHASIRALIKAGADPNQLRQAQGESALHLAAWASSVTPTTVKLLLELGAQPQLEDRAGNAVLVHAATNSEATSPSLEKVKLIGARTRDPKIRRAALMASLNHAYHDEVGLIVRYLVEQLGVDVNGADEHGVTPLMAAARVQFHQVARVLLQKGARVNALDKRGSPALFYALSSYPVVVVDTDAGESSMDLSAEFRQTLDVLLGAGADATLRNADGQTALIAYLAGDNIQYTAKQAAAVVRALLKAGAPLDGVDKEGKGALDHLRERREAAIPRRTAAQLQKLLTKK